MVAGKPEIFLNNEDCLAPFQSGFRTAYVFEIPLVDLVDGCFGG